MPMPVYSGEPGIDTPYAAAGVVAIKRCCKDCGYLAHEDDTCVQRGRGLGGVGAAVEATHRRAQQKLVYRRWRIRTRSRSGSSMPTSCS